MSIPGLITELYMPVNLSLNRSKGKVLLNSILYPLVSFRTLNLEDLKKTLYSPFPHPSPVPLLLLHLEFKLNKKSCSYFINFLDFDLELGSIMVVQVMLKVMRLYLDQIQVEHMAKALQLR